MTEHTVTVTASDGHRLQFPCREDEDVVSAAARSEIFLNAHCHSGACGSCVATVETGDFCLGGFSADALPPALRQQGKVLMCRTRPAGSLALSLPYPHAQIRFDRPPVRRALITSRSFLTPDTIKLGLELVPDADDNPALMFEPGQFVQLAVPGAGIKRPYSMANAPGWDGVLEFLIKLRAHGAFSSWLRDEACPGAGLEVEGPYGTFTLQDHGLRPRFFVAGGCGLASVLSMLRQMAEFQEPHRSRLFFGVWHPEELFFQAELAALACDHPNLTVTACVTAPSDGWTGFTGSAVAALDQALAAEPATPDLYVCGSPGLVEGVKALADRRGIAPDHVIHERYLANNPTP